MLSTRPFIQASLCLVLNISNTRMPAQFKIIHIFKNPFLFFGMYTEPVYFFFLFLQNFEGKSFNFPYQSLENYGKSTDGLLVKLNIQGRIQVRNNWSRYHIG